MAALALRDPGPQGSQRRDRSSVTARSVWPIVAKCADLIEHQAILSVSIAWHFFAWGRFGEIGQDR
jgi:hypothetical protein